MREEKRRERERGREREREREMRELGKHTANTVLLSVFVLVNFRHSKLTYARAILQEVLEKKLEANTVITLITRRTKPNYQK